MRFFTDSPVIAVRDVPHEANALRALRRRGEVWSPLPGIYAQKGMGDGWELRILAAHLWAPELVICGAAPAKLGWWPDLDGDVVELWGGQRRSPVPWLHVSRSVVQADFYAMSEQSKDMKIATPALSAIQFALTRGGDPIDEALRRNAATLAEMYEALGELKGRRGATAIRTLLDQSRKEPWSALERQAHVMLNEARITGWEGNHEVWLGGQRFFIDIAFPDLKIAIELDGLKFHSTRPAFDRDREKQNLLVLDGWTVLRYTSNTIGPLVAQLVPLLR